jgi:molybdate transport system substrate-binding protein
MIATVLRAQHANRVLASDKHSCRLHSRYFFNIVWVMFLMVTCLVLQACGRTPVAADRTLTVAAAANLTGVIEQVATEFEKQTNVHVVLSFGSTAQLAQQIEHGGPFDVFAAADTEHVDALIAKRKLVGSSRAVYAKGQLVLWVPDENKRIQRIQDLLQPDFRFIAIAQPALAPYGRAAKEALKASGIWDEVQSKITYANSISMAKQYAASGNANAAFTALSLVMKEPGTVIAIDPKLYQPLDQALAITTSSADPEAARRFTALLLGATGRGIFEKSGYLLP